MSIFSYVLSKHVHQKNIKTYALAQYCGLDRSNMYKIINGKRKPSSVKIVNKMAKFMHLSPAEEEEFQQAYQITLEGYDNYYRRKNVLSFFEEFVMTPALFASISYCPELSSTDKEIILNSQTEVTQAIFHILSSEITGKENPSVRLFIQPDSSFLMNLISVESQNNVNIHIDHILCLNNNSQTTDEQKNYNLNCLKQILPLYGRYQNYNCFYFYDDIESHTGTFSLFPHMIITSRHVCLLSANMKNGCVFCSDSALKMFNNIFDSYKMICTPLLKHINNISEQLTYVKELITKDIKGYAFQMTPCLTPFLTTAMLKKYLIPGIPDLEQVCKDFAEYQVQISPLYEQKRLINFFSFDGIRQFMKTGRSDEYPKAVCHSFEMSDRIMLVKKLIQVCKKEQIFMLKKNIGNLEHELFLFISQQNGYLMFRSPYTDIPVYLTIEEPGLIFTFYDFCENLNKEMFYSPSEAEELLQQLIKDMSVENS